MSVFVVKLQQGAQGALDLNPATSDIEGGTVTGQGLGTPFTVSKQRQVYVMGPNRINRLLKDGTTFTDCNYWKKFAYPQVSLEQAFVECLTDDGSVYGEPGGNTVPVVVNSTISYGTDVTIDFVNTYGGAATFCQLENLETLSGGRDLHVYLNGSTTSFTLYAGTSQVFNTGDLAITSVVLSCPTSGGTAWKYQVIAAVNSACVS